MQTFEPRFRDLASLLSTSVGNFPDRPLFGAKRDGQWEWMSYAAFGNEVARCRAGLAALGVSAGDRVVIIANNRIEWAVAAYATYTLRAAFVPMYESQQHKEWKFILADCGAKVAICASPEIAKAVLEMKGELSSLTAVVCLDGEAAGATSYEALLRQGEAKPRAAERPDPKETADIIYTSGTTGSPKGVVLSHANLAMNASASLVAFPYKPEDRTLSFLPWAHAFGQTAELHTLIGAGASSAICESIAKIVDNLAEVKPTVLLAVPNIFMRIHDGVRKQMAQKPKLIQALFELGLRARAKQAKKQSPSFAEAIGLLLARRLIFSKIVQRFGGRLNFAVSGGAALPKEVAEFIDALGIDVFEGYGLTETSPVATVNTPEARKIGSVGRAIPGVTVTLDHEASGSTEEGEIIISGHNVMQGYYNRPEETQKAFTKDGGFRTGDLGKLDSDGFLYVTGRIKEQYKLDNGKYVAPAALEGKLQLSPYIFQACVYGSNKPFNVAVIVPNFANLKEWAKAQGIDGTDHAKLVADEKVRALIRAEVDKQGQGFKGFESIKAFHLASEEFSIANDLLTPKLSMKRRNVVKKYEREIEALYGAAKASKGVAA